RRACEVPAPLRQPVDDVQGDAGVEHLPDRERRHLDHAAERHGRLRDGLPGPGSLAAAAPLESRPRAESPLDSPARVLAQPVRYPRALRVVRAGGPRAPPLPAIPGHAGAGLAGPGLPAALLAVPPLVVPRAVQQPGRLAGRAE